MKVQITELDITIYTSKADTLNMGFTPEREQKQIDLYRKAFNVFRETKDQITGVTPGMFPMAGAGSTGETNPASRCCLTRI